MRTFIAIEFSREVHQQLQTVCHELRAHLRSQDAPQSLRWTALDNLHLTLRFLGETTAAQAQIIATGLQEAALQHAPFALTLSGVGGFPNVRQPRVVWLGVGGDLAQLHAFQAAVEGRCNWPALRPRNARLRPTLPSPAPSALLPESSCAPSGRA